MPAAGAGRPGITERHAQSVEAVLKHVIEFARNAEVGVEPVRLYGDHARCVLAEARRIRPGLLVLGREEGSAARPSSPGSPTSWSSPNSPSSWYRSGLWPGSYKARRKASGPGPSPRRPAHRSSCPPSVRPPRPAAHPPGIRESSCGGRCRSTFSSGWVDHVRLAGDTPLNISLLGRSRRRTGPGGATRDRCRPGPPRRNRVAVPRR